jgi:hypothetical protein
MRKYYRKSFWKKRNYFKRNRKHFGVTGRISENTGQVENIPEGLNKI